MNENPGDDAAKLLYSLGMRLNHLKMQLTEAQQWSDPLEQSIAAFKALFDFVNSIEDIRADGRGWPLENLLAAIIELYGGGKPELFKGRALNHRAPTSQMQRTKRVWAAAAMQRYMDVGLKRNEAATRAARKFGCKPRTVAEWRSLGTGALPSGFDDRLEAERFREIQNRLAPEATTREAIDRAVDGALLGLRQRFPKKPPCSSEG